MLAMRDVVFLYVTGFAFYSLLVFWWRNSWAWYLIAAVMLASQWAVQRFG
jgi:hypothetical protein